MSAMSNQGDNLIFTGKLFIIINPVLAQNFEVYEISPTEIELRFNDGYPPRRIELPSITREDVRSAISAIFDMKVTLD